jgi:hypothetical protein
VERLLAVLILPTIIIAGATTGRADGGINSCVVTVGLGNSQPVRTAQFTIDYSRVQGAFARDGGSVLCESQVPGVSVAAHDRCDGDYAECQWGENRRLTVALLGGPNGFAGPVEVARCLFNSAEEPSPLDFDFTSNPPDFIESTAGTDTPLLLDLLDVQCGVGGAR